MFFCFFFFTDTPTTEIYTLSLHDALPISPTKSFATCFGPAQSSPRSSRSDRPPLKSSARSEEHTSELQSRQYLVCRLLLEKKKKRHKRIYPKIQNTPTRNGSDNNNRDR